MHHVHQQQGPASSRLAPSLSVQQLHGGGEGLCCGVARTAARRGAGGISRARRKRALASWVKNDPSSFLDLVQSAWLQGVAQAEFEASLGGLAVLERPTTHVVERAPVEQWTRQCSTRDEAASAAVTSEQSTSWQLETCDVPIEVAEVAREYSESQSSYQPSRQLALAGLPLPAFWTKLKALSKKEDPSKPFHRMMQFRRRHQWPLTISESSVARALESGMFQFLPPQAMGQSAVLTCSPRLMDTKRCSVEEYQMLAMFVFEAAFRSASAELGPVVIIDLRDISPTLAGSVFASIADVARGVAMCAGTLPLSMSHVQVIEAPSSNRFLKYVLGVLMSKLSSKILSRLSRGDEQAAAKAMDAAILPRSLGGERDADAEFSNWLAAWRAEESAL